MEAAILAVGHMRRSPATSGKRVALFVDNITVLGALKRRLSSSFKLKRLCSRFAAGLLLADFHLTL